ncbi:carbohydrate porin [Acidicapsa acidisoli]|uniref:carbohydrate porin n=1 Tax=Acidicapsa acidisoli TaxID=1615681 RepID=UPI0021DFD793|nr:carbohydrate porin [Acidicapsa acidisoli]
MQLRSSTLPGMPYVNSRERRAAASSRNNCAVSASSLGQANLVWVLTITRSIVLMVIGSLLAPSLASAQNGTPAPRPEDEGSLMQLLTDKGLHDIENESWNAYGQFTYISSWKPSFYAPYTNLNGSINSLLPTAERSFTGTATLYLGLRLWKGGEAYLVPEVISEQPLSQLRGLGGAIQNFELQKGGATVPQVYRSRLFLKQTIGLGGKSEVEESGPLQLGTHYDSRRLVFVAGNFTILDFFDTNAFDVDPRQGFLGLGFMTYAAYDFASDARGYSYGGVGEFHWDDWAVRYGRITPPKQPNQLPVDFRLLKYYGDQVEVEHKHTIHEQEGMVRLLAYRNRENMGRFSDAIAAFEADPPKNATTCTGFNYGSQNAGAPDLCWARKPNVKEGIGAFAEQYIGHDIGVFGRGMYSDGKTEVYAYTSTDRSATVGVLAKGSAWSRSKDVMGIGGNFGWISDIHAKYLGMGGIDGFVGDGAITAAAEKSLDLFYSANLGKVYWLTGDYQHITNPGFNAARGPVNVFTVRVHGEF